MASLCQNANKRFIVLVLAIGSSRLLVDLVSIQEVPGAGRSKASGQQSHNGQQRKLGCHVQTYSG